MTILNSTAVNVTWIPLNSRDVSNYVVYYSESSGSLKRRQASGRVEFSSSANWGVVSRLNTGTQYQFEVVAVVEVTGIPMEGSRSQSASAIPGGSGGGS